MGRKICCQTKGTVWWVHLTPSETVMTVGPSRLHLLAVDCFEKSNGWQCVPLPRPPSPSILHSSIVPFLSHTQPQPQHLADLSLTIVTKWYIYSNDVFRNILTLPHPTHLDLHPTRDLNATSPQMPHPQLASSRMLLMPLLLPRYLPLLKIRMITSAFSHIQLL